MTPSFLLITSMKKLFAAVSNYIITFYTKKVNIKDSKKAKNGRVCPTLKKTPSADLFFWIKYIKRVEKK